MPDALRRGGLSLPSSDGVKRWISLPWLAERLGVARALCVLALCALLFSALSPGEGLGRPDLSRHRRSGHRVATPSELARASHLAKAKIGAAAPIVASACAAPILSSVDHAAAPVVFLAWSSSLNCGLTHAGRAPPIS